MLQDQFVHFEEDFTINITLGANNSANTVTCYIGTDPYRPADVVLSSANTEQVVLTDANTNSYSVNYKLVPGIWTPYKTINYRVDVTRDDKVTTHTWGKIFISPSVFPQS